MIKKKKKVAWDGRHDLAVGCILLVCSFAQFLWVILKQKEVQEQ